MSTTYHYYLSQGLCGACGRAPQARDRSCCTPCLRKANARTKAWKAKKREYDRLYEATRPKRDRRSK